MICEVMDTSPCLLILTDAMLSYTLGNDKNINAHSQACSSKKSVCVVYENKITNQSINKRCRERIAQLNMNHILSVSFTLCFWCR